MTMNKIILGLGLGLTLMIIYSCSTKPTIDDKFNGTYRLDKFESRDSVSGKWKEDKWRGKYADGFIQYDGKGHMSVHLYPRDYKEFDTNKNIDSLDLKELRELTRFYQSNFVYFADYKISDTTIAHTRTSATEPRNWGTVLTRSFEFTGDTLILTPHEKLENKKMRLRWVRLGLPK